MSYGHRYEEQPAAAGQETSQGGYGQANPYGQNYELQNISGNAPGAAGGSAYGVSDQQRATLTQKEFLDRVQGLRDDIKGLTNDIDYIGQLHQRTLSSTDGRGKQELEQFVTQTQVRNTAIKDGVKSLERDLARTTDTSRTTKSTQLQSLKTFFQSELRKYESIERDYREKYREQIARQYRIVNPDASEQEVRDAANADWGNEGVFQTAIKSNRTGHAASALGNVRARHNELQSIEKTLMELNILFQELATVVALQEEPIAAIDEGADKTRDNLEQGNTQVAGAVEHARRARKLKWWCLGITILILILVGVGVGVGITLSRKA